MSTARDDHQSLGGIQDYGLFVGELAWPKKRFHPERTTDDLIFAVNGYHRLSAYRRALNPQGHYVCAGGTLPQIFQAMLLGSLMSRKHGKKMGFMGITKYNQKDLIYLKELLESGRVTPVIKKCYPLNEVPLAMRYLVEGHATGKIVLMVDQRQGPDNLNLEATRESDGVCQR